jgi:hypothetical protein
LRSAVHASDASLSCTWASPNHIKWVIKIVIVGEDIILGQGKRCTHGHVLTSSWIDVSNLCKDLGYIWFKILDAFAFLKLKAKITRALLYKMYVSYTIIKAFWEVDFGDNPLDVYGAMVDDVIHVNELENNHIHSRSIPPTLLRY